MTARAELARRNRRLLAERGNWPDGAVEACELIEADYPEWHATWCAGGWMTWKDAGYYARRRRHYHLEPYDYGATPDDLRTAIETKPGDDR